MKMNMIFWQFTRLHAQWDCLFPSTVSSSPGVSPVARWQFTPFVNRRTTSEVPLVCMSVPVQSEKGEGGCGPCCSHSHVDSGASHTSCQLLDQVRKCKILNEEHWTCDFISVITSSYQWWTGFTVYWSSLESCSYNGLFWVAQSRFMKILQAISAGELVPLSKDNLTETSRVKWIYLKLYF